MEDALRLLALALVLAAQADASKIELPNRSFDPPRGVQPELAQKLAATTQGSVPALVQLERLPLREERGRLAQAGIELGSYVGGNAYFARIAAGTQLQTIGPPFRWAGVTVPQDKIAPELWRAVESTPPGGGTGEAVVHFEDGTAPERQRELLEKHARSFSRFGGSRSFAIEIEPERVARLADEEPVRWIELRPAGPRPLAEPPPP